jgi:hypothetical protein
VIIPEISVRMLSSIGKEPNSEATPFICIGSGRECSIVSVLYESSRKKWQVAFVTVTP